MKFLIITHAVHKYYNNNIYAYEPYVREMNLWGKYVDSIQVLAPVSNIKIDKIESFYTHKNISINPISSFDTLSLKNKFNAFLKIPNIFFQIFKLMKKADHIHLRCPGNIGLLGCCVQILFPSKPKTVKYAGNWDPKSKQPISYKLQKWIVSNVFLTKNCKVLVYGNWKNQSKNILPFFTASYRKNEIVETPTKKILNTIKFIFVGTFSVGKKPMLSVKTIQKLLLKGYKVELNMYGNGVEFERVQEYIQQNNLEKIVFLHGNQSKEILKEAYQKSHFLVFISKSEGWPKVVAEAMFWKCLPISSKVSCIEDMLGYGERGSIVNADSNDEELLQIIENYLKQENLYQQKIAKAQKWSQKYTLDLFELEIKKLL